FASSHLCLSLGYSPREFCKITTGDLFVDLPAVDSIDSDHFSGIVSIRAKDKSISKVYLYLKILRGQETEIFGICYPEIGGHTDVTDAFADYLLSFCDIFLYNPAVLLIARADSSIIAANYAAERFYGYAPAELMEMRVSDIDQLPPEIFAMEYASAFNGNKSFFIAQHKTANSLLYDVSIHVSVAALHGVPAICMIV
ncbi:MAG: PAS domain-containing protein, partial [Deferribacteraceae bacterium]|nr:PAS domain-containing protein [Deferribacteraceae bacterium]